MAARESTHTRPPDSSSHNFNFNTLAAKESASFSVSPGATAAKTSTPFPILETTSWSTATEADRTRWRIAGPYQVGIRHDALEVHTFHGDFASGWH